MCENPIHKDNFILEKKPRPEISNLGIHSGCNKLKTQKPEASKGNWMW